MDPVTYIKNTYEIISDISPKNYAKLARNKIDGRLYVLKYLKVYDIEVYDNLKRSNIGGISKIYEVMPSPGGLYIVEEYIDGYNLEMMLDTLMNNGEKMDSIVRDYTCQLLNTLRQLHKLRPPVIHRDIKPDNIMVDKNGNVKLIDFNISRGFTGSSARDTFAMGTSEFAAPEQYGFLESDPRTDIYGLGATVKYLINKYGIESPDLRDFVDRATAFEPSKRFESADHALYFLINYQDIVNGIKPDFDKAAKASGWKKFLPPGYRSGNIVHIFIASFVYIMVLVFTRYSLVVVLKKPAEEKGQYILALIIYLLMFFSVTFFSFDYMGVQRLLGLDKIEKSKRRKSIIMIDILILIIILFIGAFFINKV
ncbi:MAG: protein kinase [Eubacterium sp.]|nr:protein kinase [Eubacterium sp.]